MSRQASQPTPMATKPQSLSNARQFYPDFQHAWSPEACGTDTSGHLAFCLDNREDMMARQSSDTKKPGLADQCIICFKYYIPCMIELKVDQKVVICAWCVLDDTQSQDFDAKKFCKEGVFAHAMCRHGSNCKKGTY